MKEFHYTIKAANGIHAVPACKLSAEVRHFKAKMIMAKNEKTADMSDVIDLMGLNVKKADQIVIKAEGPDEEQAIAHISKIIEMDL